MITATASRLTTPTAQDLAEVRAATSIEREWFKDWPRYETNDDVQQAIERGRLIAVLPDENIMPIYRLRNPRTDNWAYNERLAVRRMNEMAGLWRECLDERGLDPEGFLRLAVTSLLRTGRQQDGIVKQGALAVPTSSHSVAFAWDKDASGYFRRDPIEGLQSVYHPDRPQSKLQKIASELATQAGLSIEKPPIPRPDLYDPGVPAALLDVAAYMHRLGVINAVVEFADSYNQCIHSAANPLKATIKVVHD